MVNIAFKNGLIALALLALSTTNLTAKTFDWKANKWEQIDDSEGIKVFRKAFKNSDVKGVAGAALIEAPASKIIWVLMDHDHKDQWVDKFYKAHTIETPNLLSSVQYAAFDMPLFIADRDFVYRYEFTYDDKLGAIVVDSRSVTHPSAPAAKTVGVRGEIVMGKYRLYPRDGGKSTYVEVEYLADPKGSLPVWLVNLVQKSWPFKTLKGLKKQVKKPFVKDHPIITEGFRKYLATDK